MLRIIEQTRKENFYGKDKIKVVLSTKGYGLKLNIIGKKLNVLMKRGRM